MPSLLPHHSKVSSFFLRDVFLFSLLISVTTTTVATSVETNFRSFNDLPSNYGWEYADDAEPGTPPPPIYYSIDGNTLVQNTVGIGDNHAYFYAPRWSAVDSSLPFLLTVECRVIETEQIGPYGSSGEGVGFGTWIVHDDNMYMIRWTTSKILILNHNEYAEIAFNNTKSHEFQLLGGVGGNNWTFFIDGETAATGTGQPGQAGTTYDLIIGDGGGSENAHGEWSSYVFYQDSSLPVHFSAFSASYRDGAVNLTWTTESEVNSLGFNVWRKAGSATDWSKLNNALIPSHYDSWSCWQYKYVDDRVEAGKTYRYYIENVDRSGLANCTKDLTISIPFHTVNPSAFELTSLYPNPAKDHITVQFRSKEAQFISWTIYNLLGQQVHHIPASQSTAGEHNMLLNLPELANGLYFIRLRGENSYDVKSLHIFR